MTPGTLPMALLRLNYRLARIPLQLIEDLGMSRLDEQAPTRLAYEQLLIGCDRAAACLLGDEHAAARATDLRRHTAAVRVTIARHQRRIHHEGVILLDQQRSRFHQRRQRPPGHRPGLNPPPPLLRPSAGAGADGMNGISTRTRIRVRWSATCREGRCPVLLPLRNDDPGRPAPVPTVGTVHAGGTIFFDTR